MKQIILLILLLQTAGSVMAGDIPQRIIAPGDLFPALPLPGEGLTAQQRSYLGISGSFFSFLQSKNFPISDIAAELVVVEFFNNYCTSCQAQAPVMNSVFALVAADKNLSGKVKFVGIGAGNNAKEVDSFRSAKQVAFPLVPDPDFVLYKAIGDPGATPFTVMVTKKEGRAVAASVHRGLVHEPEYFIRAIQSALRGAPAEPEERQAVGAASQRMFELNLSENDLMQKIKSSMLRARDVSAMTAGPAAVVLPSGATVYRGETGAGSTKTVLYSQVIRRKPVCDVCHGIHFIITFNTDGVVLDFTPIHVTKLGNVEWQEAEVNSMRQKLAGRSLKNRIPFSPEADAVSTATMSSSLIFNSINDLEQIVTELQALKN